MTGVVTVQECWAGLDKHGRAALLRRLAGEDRIRSFRSEWMDSPFAQLDERIRQELERGHQHEVAADAWLTNLDKVVSLWEFCTKRFPDICRQNVNALTYDLSSRSFRHTREGMTYLVAGRLSPNLAATEILVLRGSDFTPPYERRWEKQIVIGRPDLVSKVAELEAQRRAVVAEMQKHLNGRV